MSVFDEIERQKTELESFKKKKKRNKLQKQADYNKISEYYIEGVNQATIAKIMGLSQSQVSNDLEAIRQGWVKETSLEIDVAKAERIKDLEKMKKEAWEAWEKSKRTRQVKTKRGGLANNTPTGRGQFEIIEEEDLGDIRYFQMYMQCHTELCKLYGLYAPNKIAQTDVTGTKDATTAAAARDEVLSWLDQQAAKLSGTPQKQLQPANLAETMENKDYIDAEEIPDEPKEEKITFEIIGNGKGMVCMLCDKVTWKPQEVARRYCSKCNLEHEDLDQKEQDEEDSKQVNPEDLNLNNPANSVMEENPEISVGGQAQHEIKHNQKHDINMSRKMDETSRMTNFGFKDGILKRGR